MRVVSCEMEIILSFLSCESFEFRGGGGWVTQSEKREKEREKVRQVRCWLLVGV